MSVSSVEVRAAHVGRFASHIFLPSVMAANLATDVIAGFGYSIVVAKCNDSELARLSAVPSRVVLEFGVDAVSGSLRVSVQAARSIC
jgi:hypothetical protein